MAAVRRNRYPAHLKQNFRFLYRLKQGVKFSLDHICSPVVFWLCKFPLWVPRILSTLFWKPSAYIIFQTTVSSSFLHNIPFSASFLFLLYHFYYQNFSSSLYSESTSFFISFFSFFLSYISWEPNNVHRPNGLSLKCYSQKYVNIPTPHLIKSLDPLRTRTCRGYDISFIHPPLQTHKHTHTHKCNRL